MAKKEFSTDFVRLPRKVDRADRIMIEDKNTGEEYFTTIDDIGEITDEKLLEQETEIKEWANEKFEAAKVVQTTGTDVNRPMSQKAVTDELNKKLDIDISDIQVDFLKTQNILPEDQGIVKYFSLPDRADDFSYYCQIVPEWSKYGFWSFAVAKFNTIVDEIQVPLFSIAPLTGDLIVKIFVDGKLVANLIKPNNELGNTTIVGYRAEIVLPHRLVIKSGQQIVFGWEMSNSEKIQLVHKTIAVDANYPFGLNKMIYNAEDGSIISATVPPSAPSSGDWFLPIYCMSYKIYDKSNPNEYAINSDFEEHESNLIHTLLLEKSSNVLNPNTSIFDKYINSSGGVSTASDMGIYAASDFIEWGSNTEAIFGCNGVPYPYFSVAQYDANKVFIAGTGFVNINAYTLSKASGAFYFRIGYKRNYLNQINFGTELLEYEPFYYKINRSITNDSVIFKSNLLDDDLNERFNKLKQQDVLISKNGGQIYNEILKIDPPGTVWSSSSSFINKWWAVWLKGITTKTINRISIPIVKNFYNGLNFTDGLVVKIFYNNLLLLDKIIPFSEVSPYNNLTVNSPVSDFLYHIDLPIFELRQDDILYIGVECIGANDKISMLYKMNGTPSDVAEWTRNYTSDGANTGGVISLSSPPALPSSKAFYRVVKCYFLDYIGKQIDDKISGGVKQDLTIMPPKKIYTVFNDQLGTGDDALFNVRMHSIPLYFDSLVNNITSELDVNFKKSGKEKIQLYSPELTSNKSSQNITLLFGNSSKYKDGSVSFIQKNVKESVGKNLFPKILCIGDSVTAGYLANVGLSDPSIAPAQYWSVIKEQFEKAKIDAVDKADEHNCVMVGRLSKTWNLTYGGVVNRPMKTYAEGAGGWSSSDHLYYSRNWGNTNSQGFWDLLGLGDGTGTDYTESSLQKQTIATTPEGLYAPKNTSAFLSYINSELGLSLTTYNDAVAALNTKETNPENPFYDKTTAQEGIVAFSLKAYIDRYKTLDSDGKTRLVVGSTAGTKVTDVNAYDVCVPTHIIIQHSHNDGDVSWFASNIRKWTDAIKAEYTANNWGIVNIGLSVIRHTGTYYPQRYPMFDCDSIALWRTDASMGFNNYAKLMSEFWIDDLNEDTERIFLLPSLNVQPTAWAIPFRKLPSAEWDITGIEEHNFRVIDGAGPDWHPNAIAHRSWGMEMYAWVRYTLSL